jgi:hypothetical protein
MCKEETLEAEEVQDANNAGNTMEFQSTVNTKLQNTQCGLSCFIVAFVIQPSNITTMVDVEFECAIDGNPLSCFWRTWVAVLPQSTALTELTMMETTNLPTADGQQ